jgi:hypothetical protein
VAVLGEEEEESYVYFFLSHCSVRAVTLCSKRFALVHDLATPFILICVLVIIQRYTSSVRSTCRHYLGVIFKMEWRRW